MRSTTTTSPSASSISSQQSRRYSSPPSCCPPAASSSRFRRTSASSDPIRSFCWRRWRRPLLAFLLLSLLLLLHFLRFSSLPLLLPPPHRFALFAPRFLCDFGFLKRALKCAQFGGTIATTTMQRHRPFKLIVGPPWGEDERGGPSNNEFDGEREDGVVVRDVESCSGPMRLWREREAVAALHAAKRSRSEGNLRRARSIIEHAYSLAPYNADILTEYGVYVEMARSDVVEAEGFYLKALVRDPKHAEALIRRQKALPLVEEIDNRMMREIHRKRDRFMHIPRNDSGLRRSMRESYFAHVYHTVAMEGNTINLAQTRSILETRMAVAGKSIIEHNEILGLDAALRYLNHSLTEVRDITLEHILALHKRVLGYADPLAAGVIRTEQVFVGSFRPPDPEFVLAEMEELILWLNDEETQSLDAVELAALLHYKLVFIHPFTDGNGRTARLLMNWILLRAGFPPVIIPVEQRHRYYHVLREANEGDLRPFIRFIAELTDRTLESLIASSSSSICEIGGNCSPAGHAADVDGGQEAHVGQQMPAAAAGPQPFCAAVENEPMRQH